jgi:hypothetical protein
MVYNRLILILEADDCLMADCPAIYNAFGNILLLTVSQTHINGSKEFASNFLLSLNNRIASTGDINFLFLIASFTHQGRRLLRSQSILDHEPEDLLDKMPHDDDVFFHMTDGDLKRLKHFTEALIPRLNLKKRELGNLLNIDESFLPIMVEPDLEESAVYLFYTVFLLMIIIHHFKQSSRTMQ